MRNTLINSRCGLNYSKLTFRYIKPDETYEKILDALDDLVLVQIAKEREFQESIPVEIDDL